MPRRTRSSYFHRSKNQLNPLVLSIIILAGGFALFFIVRSVFFGESGAVAETELHTPPNNTVYVQFDSEDTFHSVSSAVVKILENERIDTRNTANASLQFFENSRLVLDSNTKAELLRSREHKGEAREIRVELESGQIWGEVSSSLNPRSLFAIVLSPEVVLTTKNGHFSVNAETETVKVAAGSVRLTQFEDSAEIAFKDVGVGQQFSFSGNNIEENVLAILTEDDWFQVHSTAQGSSSLPSPDEDTTDPENESEDTPSTPAVSGNISITVPGKRDGKYTITDDPQEIAGTVPQGTARVVVNDYTLQKFASGDRSFSYVAATTYGSLSTGENEYTIEAIAANGDIIDRASITLIYQSEAADVPAEEETNDTAEESPSNNDTLFAIATPNGGEDVIATAADFETGFDISGTAPANTAKVVVNTYTLSQFSLGDTSWIYRIREEFGNMEAGENVYTVTAFDADGEEIGSESISITFPEDSSDAEE